MKLILASESPRRRELLHRAGFDFTAEAPEVAELTSASDLKRLPGLNARLKAASVFRKHPDCVVLGADTVVFYQGKVLGKPEDLSAARAMLRLLSGGTHHVITGIALFSPGAKENWSEITSVTFKSYDETVIDRYLATVPVLDKAGAYGIQDHGELLVSAIDGELENVIGLPLRRLTAKLRQLKFGV